MLEERVILKEDDIFVVSELTGDITARDEAGMGLYRADTRFLSLYELRLNGQSPILLNCSVDRAYVATFQLVNPALYSGETCIPRQSLSIRRTRFVHQGMHERLGIQNCNQHAVDFELELRFEADFRDIFEVRGYTPAPTVPMLQVKRALDPVQQTETGLVLGYEGLDGIHRRTEVVFDPIPEIGSGAATMRMHMEPYETRVLLIDVVPMLGEQPMDVEFQFDYALAGLEQSYRRWNSACTDYRTDNQRLDQGILWRSQEDLRVLCDARPTGLFPTAGVPWLAVPFGRDALITSLQTLSLNPELARGSLRYLAQHQGREVDPEREEEPGKILHEMRVGELANTRRIPHTPYYGTVDSTPLFLVLLVELMRWTGDVDLLSELALNVKAALEWIDRYGDLDGDGLVEYASHSHYGVHNHGWRDHWDALLDRQGSPAHLPAALVEVQGYVYHAKAGLARIYRHVGRRQEADRLDSEASALRKRFNERYWMPDQRFYALALDKDKDRIATIGSSVGHCLWSGIIDPEHAESVVSRLVSPDMFSGWGVRTISTGSINYNPMSYHNGSVWPHDNSIIALGMRRYGFHKQAEQVARSVLEACMRFRDHRIPELFCGFSRDQRFGSPPGEYLVSCSPQSWGAGSLFHFLQILTGIEVDVLDNRLRIDPLQTNLYRRLRVEGMQVGGGQLDFPVDMTRGISVRIDRQPSDLRVVEVPA
jgi:glycogen debranching enzyme